MRKLLTIIVVLTMAAISVSAQTPLEEWEEFATGANNFEVLSDGRFRLTYSMSVPASGGDGRWIPRAIVIDKPYFFTVETVQVHVTPGTGPWNFRGIGSGWNGQDQWFTASISENSTTRLVVAVANQKHDWNRQVTLRVTGQRDEAIF